VLIESVLTLVEVCLTLFTIENLHLGHLATPNNCPLPLRFDCRSGPPHYGEHESPSRDGDETRSARAGAKSLKHARTPVSHG